MAEEPNIIVTHKGKALAFGDFHGPTAPQSQSFTRAEMGNMYVGDADITPSLYHVYLYTTSRREHVVEQPPLIPYLIIPACKDSEEYKLVIAIPHPMLQIERHPDKNEAIIYRHAAERVAQSICNPDNPSLDQDFVNARRPSAIGVNLNAQGVFWSRNNPPKAEEIEAARKRVEKYYRGLLETARTLEVANPKELESLLNQDYHMAAEYAYDRFPGYREIPWHPRQLEKVECPNCGERIKNKKLAYHVNSAGLVCVIDVERAAVALAGQEQGRTAKSSRSEDASSRGPESPSRAKSPRRGMQSSREE